MATLRITEYITGVVQSGRPVSAGQEPSETVQNVTFTTAALSSAFSPNVRLIRLKADAKVHFKVSKATEATAATALDTQLEANAAEYFGVFPGFVLSAYDGTS